MQIVRKKKSEVKHNLSLFSLAIIVAAIFFSNYIVASMVNEDTISQQDLAEEIGNIKDNYPREGWSGWIDDGTNTNCTYSKGILIDVQATSGIAGYKKY